MNIRNCYVEYYGFGEWRFNIYRDGDMLFSSKPFNSELECKQASELWLMNNR